MSAAVVVREVVLVLLALNGLRVTLGIPPVSYWFRSHSCPTCNGVGHVKKVSVLKAGAVRVTRDGETLDVEIPAGERDE